MRSAIILLFLVAAFCIPGFAQDKPLTQPEYVQLLYKLERKTATKEDVVDALRRRGIGFALTDGVRSLTRSKGANDDELKRALEEAERRRKDPEGTKIPTQLEVAGIIDLSCYLHGKMFRCLRSVICSPPPRWRE